MPTGAKDASKASTPCPIPLGSQFVRSTHRPPHFLPPSHTPSAPLNHRFPPLLFFTLQFLYPLPVIVVPCLPLHPWIVYSSTSPPSRGRVQNIVKEKINLAKGDSINDRKSQIRKDLDEIRVQQSDKKPNRRKVIEHLKVLQEGIQKNVRHIRFCPAYLVSHGRVTDQGPQCFQGQGQVQVR